MFRYQRPAENPSPPEWLDGAVFTYVLTTGTDAEVLIIIEARKGPDGNWQWQYAPARITNRPPGSAWERLRVWPSTATRNRGPITIPYTTFYAGQKTAAELKLRARPVRGGDDRGTGARPRRRRRRGAPPKPLPPPTPPRPSPSPDKADLTKPTGPLRLTGETGHWSSDVSRLAFESPVTLPLLAGIALGRPSCGPSSAARSARRRGSRGGPGSSSSADS